MNFTDFTPGDVAQLETRQERETEVKEPKARTKLLFSLIRERLTK